MWRSVVKVWIVAMSLFISCELLYSFANALSKENIEIQGVIHHDCNAFSDLYASRGEDYLISGNDQKALEDFMCSYQWALKCKDTDSFLAFRALFGAFLVYIRCEDLELARNIYSELECILDGWTCVHYREPTLDSSRHDFVLPVLSRYSDYPIYGPEQIPIRDCLDRVNTTIEAITFLIAVVKKNRSSNFSCCSYSTVGR